VTELKTISSTYWSRKQALTLALFSLLLGACGGWLIRRSLAGQVPHPAVAANVSAPAGMGSASSGFSSVPVAPTPEDLKQAADSQAAPLLEQLKDDPANAALLAQIGNLYYDAKQYPIAIDYYERSLQSEPNDTSVRTDLGTAYWYKGDADTAIAQFGKSLAIEPTKADTLFNLGIVKWQGKKDAQGAIAAWQKLLDTNPDYPNRDNVLQLIGQAQNR